MKKIFIILIIVSLIIVSLILYNIESKFNHADEKNWNIDKKEYPKNEYSIDELPVSHKSAQEVRQFFEDSDLNHDKILKDDEINLFDYKIKHSQYTFNGPYGYS